MAFPLVLRLDISGLPMTWISWEDAVSLYTRDMVAWTAGESMFSIRGGVNRATGLRSSVDINSIIAVKRRTQTRFRPRTVPPLNNRELFYRDGNLCLYCGRTYTDSQLTRDHVKPVSRGGLNIWSNVVAACKTCNTRKGDRLPEEANMALLAIPYEPNWAEYLALSNRRILVDQMDFLKSQFSQEERLLSLNDLTATAQ